MKQPAKTGGVFTFDVVQKTNGTHMRAVLRGGAVNTAGSRPVPYSLTPFVFCTIYISKNASAVNQSINIIFIKQRVIINEDR